MGKKTQDQRRTDLSPLEVIRVETALSRYPVHRLAKMGTIDIEFREADERGETVLQWEVSYNSKWGQPGPLAYKLDTLVINRRIEEGPRRTPRLITLGSRAAIARELGISTHNPTPSIKKALHQNASTYITAKIRYRTND